MGLRGGRGWASGSGRLGCRLRSRFRGKGGLPAALVLECRVWLCGCGVLCLSPKP